MIIIARYPVELDGHIYHKGESCDYAGEVTRRIADNFTDADGKPLAASASSAANAATADREAANRAAVRKTIEVMGRDGIRRALDAINAAYSPNAKTECLARTLLMCRGEYSE